MFSLFTVSRNARLGLLLWVPMFLPIGAPVSLCRVQADDTAVDRGADQYWQILQRRPRQGTAFDRWYEHYRRADRLEELRRRVEDAIESQPDTTHPRLLRGLLHEREGQTADASAAYEVAERLDPDDYYAPYRRGLIFFSQQQYADAAEALTRSLRLEPARNDFVTGVQTLLRCRLRGSDADAARAVWDEFSAAVAGDPNLTGRLAEIAAAEGEPEWAIELWQSVADQPQAAPDVRLSARLQTAQLRADHGQTETAVDEFRECLSQLRPDSWLARDVCRRIEQTFLQARDEDGLVSFWREQQGRRPEDLQVLQQLAGALQRVGRSDEALDIYRRGIEVAPSHEGLRRALLDLLLDLREYREAAEQCEAILAFSGPDTDVLRMLGQLYLKAAAEQDQAEAQEKAIAAWQQIADARPTDPSAALLAAEACRHSALVPSALRNPSDRLRISDGNRRLIEAAETFYRRAVDRARAADHEDAAAYLEHLGEFFHALDRPESAIAAWQSISTPPHDSPALLLETAGILLKYGYPSEAEEAARKAAKRSPESFRAFEMLLDAALQRRDFDAAFAQLAPLAAAAATPLQRDDVRRRFVQVSTLGKFTHREIKRLERSVDVSRPAVEDLWLLGLLMPAAGRSEEAISVFEQAVQQEAGNAALLRDYATVLQQNRKYDEAIEQYEQLISLEPQRRTAHYRALVKLQMGQGQYDRAREVHAKLVEIAPLDSSTYQLGVDLARWRDDREAEQSLLRQAVLKMPRDIHWRRALAQSLADTGELQQALDEWWRCWELSTELPEQLSLIASASRWVKSSELRQSLTDRLRAAESSRPRTVAICLAELYRRTGEPAQARRTLAGFLGNDGRDVDVLRQLAAIAAEEQDWSTAMDYQQQAVHLDAGWINVFDWARYYRESKRDEWLTESRERQRLLMQSWASTFRQYRGKLQSDDPDEAGLQALRQELINLNWARNKYHAKEQLLDPELSYVRSRGNMWDRLQLDFEILERAGRGPLTAEQVGQRLGDLLHRAHAHADAVLETLCEKDFLEKRTVAGEEHYVARLPADELLAAAIRDFGKRMLGAEIELSDVEAAKLERLVKNAGKGKNDANP